MAAILDIVHNRWDFNIAWFEDGEEGGFLGQDPKDGTGDPPKDRDSWEHWAASRAVRTDNRNTYGFCWETLKEAKAALALARAAIKHKRPLPEWATTALSHGWKPPKGWKP